MAFEQPILPPDSPLRTVYARMQVTAALCKGNPDPEEKKLFMDVVKARVQASDALSVLKQYLLDGHAWALMMGID